MSCFPSRAKRPNRNRKKKIILNVDLSGRSYLFTFISLCYVYPLVIDFNSQYFLIRKF